MRVLFTEKLPAVDDVSNPLWDLADAVVVSTYWSGERAPHGRAFEARSLWNGNGISIRFIANQSEPLVIGSQPVVSSKTMGLWDRDVCEIFIAPDTDNPSRYFEFEIAPTGEWLDLGVHQLADRRETDWDFASGMVAFGDILNEKVVMSAQIPWSALGRIPSAGDVWKGNLFRCVGSGDSRGYLAWRPTMTETPNFHVHQAFGEFSFSR